MPDRHTDTSSLRQKLQRDGLIEERAGQWRTTSRWMGAMSRSALSLLTRGERGSDLRVPIALALVDVYGEEASEDELAALVEVMLPIEHRELAPPLAKH
jgi:hypothetical protein